MSVEIVREVRAQYPTPMTPEQCVKCSNEVAARCNQRDGMNRWGLREKTTGVNALGYALDVIVDRLGAPPYGVDILIAAPDRAEPSWQTDLTPPPEGWLAVWSPVRTDWLGDPDPDPDPDPGDLEARLRALEGRVGRLEARFRQAGEVMAGL